MNKHHNNEQEIINLVKFYTKYYYYLEPYIDVESVCLETMINILPKYNPDYQCSLKTFYKKNLDWAIKNELRQFYERNNMIKNKFLECVEYQQIPYLTYQTTEQQYVQYELKTTLEFVIRSSTNDMLTVQEVVDVLLNIKPIVHVFPNIPKQTASYRMKQIKHKIKSKLRKKEFKWIRVH